ncbi:MAG: rod shape-determining protein MreC, partial [Dorea sp.]|nr:rod shape-determining protein MreC [Dorea sp.]
MKNKKQSSFSSKYWLIIISVVCVILLGIERFTDGGGPLRFIAGYTVIPMQEGI